MAIKNMLRTLLPLIFIFGSTIVYAATPACTINANGEVTNDVDAMTAGSENGCYVTPDVIYLPVYKVGLCSSIPTYNNYLTECTFLLDSATATEVEVEKNQTFNVVDNITLTEGNYPAAVLLLGTSIAYKHKVNFTISQDGWSDAGAVTSGTTCVSRTVSGNQDDIASNSGGFYECGASTLIAGKFTESSGAYEDNGTCQITNGAVERTNNSSPLEFSTSSGSTVMCGMFNESTLETGTGSNTNATRVLAIQTFTNPVTISPTTSSMEIGLKVTDMLGLEKHLDTNDNSYYNAFLDGVELKVTAQ